jgi:hypothetical protein
VLRKQNSRSDWSAILRARLYSVFSVCLEQVKPKIEVKQYCKDVNIYVKTDTPSAGKEQESPAALGTAVTTFLSWCSSISAIFANSARKQR